MKYRKINNAWVIVLAKGDKITEKLLEFCRKEGVNSGYFQGIGAVGEAEIAHYNPRKKKYSSKLFTEPLEIISLLGDISHKEDDILIHAHIAVSGPDMVCYGGHLKEATVSATCEIILNGSGIRLDRKHNEETGLNLIEL